MHDLKYNKKDRNLGDIEIYPNLTKLKIFKDTESKPKLITDSIGYMNK